MIYRPSIKIFLFSLCFLLTISFQNCSRFTAKLKKNQDFSFLNFEEQRIPDEDRIDPDCMTKNEYDSCIFFKNPIYQNQEAISDESWGPSQFDHLQVFGVKLRNRSSILLENARVKVLTKKAPRVIIRGTSFKPLASADNSKQLAQVMAYYYSERFFGFFEEALPSAVTSQIFKIIVDDDFTGYVPKANSIHLSESEPGKPLAYDASVLVHFLGLSVAHLASGGRLSPEHIDRNHEDCMSTPNNCCRSAKGCANAILSGVGDYFVALMFPESPSTGQTYANSISGQSVCDITRNLNISSKNTSMDNYYACEDKKGNGQVTALGITYASAWWNSREHLKRIADPHLVSRFDSLFIRHLSDLDGRDTFSSALNKILELDRAMNEAVFSPIIRSEFQKLGIISE